MLSKTSTQRTYCRPSSVSRGGIGYPDHQKTLTLPGGERRRGPVLGCLQGGPTKLEGSSRHNRRTQQEWGPYNPGNPSCSPGPVRTGWHHGHSVPDERTRKNQGRNLAVWLFFTRYCSRMSEARSKPFAQAGPGRKCRRPPIINSNPL